MCVGTNKDFARGNNYLLSQNSLCLPTLTEVKTDVPHLHMSAKPICAIKQDANQCRNRHTWGMKSRISLWDVMLLILRWMHWLMRRHMIIKRSQNKPMVLTSMFGRWRRYDVNNSVPLLIWKLRAIVFFFQFSPSNQFFFSSNNGGKIIWI